MFLLLVAGLFALRTDPSVLLAKEDTFSTSTLRTMATTIAKEHGLNISHFLSVIDCEDPTWDVKRQSDYIRPDGTREQSYGLAQIYLPSHADISYDQATDPAFSLNWMATEWQQDRAYEWTCWRSMYR